jgi:hypothetical protein
VGTGWRFSDVRPALEFSVPKPSVSINFESDHPKEKCKGGPSKVLHLPQNLPMLRICFSRSAFSDFKKSEGSTTRWRERPRERIGQIACFDQAVGKDAVQARPFFSRVRTKPAMSEVVEL